MEFLIINTQTLSFYSETEGELSEPALPYYHSHLHFGTVPSPHFPVLQASPRKIIEEHLGFHSEWCKEREREWGEEEWS